MPERFDSGWWQTSMIPPEAFEFTLKVGVVPESDHGQWWIEAKDPTTGVLLGMWSSPHLRVRGLRDAVRRAVEDLLDQIDGLVEPF